MSRHGFHTFTMPEAPPFDREDPFFDDDDPDEEEDFFDCHMGPGGYCGAAGSEDCEFECPYRRAQRNQNRARMIQGGTY